MRNIIQVVWDLFALEPHLELRPHHALGLIDFERDPKSYSIPDEYYAAYFRAKHGETLTNPSAGYHSDELLLHFRGTMREMHERPWMTFKYVLSIDSVCTGCNNISICSNPAHPAYDNAMREDLKAIEYLPELELGKKYTSLFLRKLFKEKAWM
ncbi:hypothetical protein ACFL96_18075 [Thermoproteota archaeon]